MDFGKMLKIQQAWNTFKSNHPQFPRFVNDVRSRGIQENCDITISIAYPDGQVMKAGIHVKPSDLELLNTLQSMQS